MRHKDENKSKSIYKAAIQLVNEQGLSATSMSKIAKRAGISSSTIYVYFDNKEDMLNKLYLMIKKDMSVEIFQHYDDSISIRASFEYALKKYLDFILNNKDEFLFIEQFSNSPLLHNLSEEEGTLMFDPVIKLLEEGKSQDIFKQVDTNLLYIAMVNLCMQYVKECYAGRITFKQEDISIIVDMTWDAIKKDEI